MDKSNKYLFTIRSLTGGGAERVVTTLASRMARDGYDVSILSYDKSEDDYEIDELVKVYYMPKPKNGLIGKVYRIKDMDLLIEKISPDVIIPFVGTILYVSYIVAKKRRIPYIRTVRNSPWSEGGRFYDYIIRNHINRRSTAIMVQNREQLEYFSDELKKKIYVVPNPVSKTFIDERKTNYSNNIKKIVSVGRLTEQKNQKFLIESFSEFHKKHRNVVLEIYGTGMEEKKLQSLIQQEKIEDCCFLKGRNSHIVDVLKEADLFVMTSKWEGMPNALMEAMCMGVPCISSNCKTGPSSLIQHKINGLLYSEGSKEEFIHLLEWAYENSKQLEEMGNKARVRILKNYTYEKIYHDLIVMLNAIKKNNYNHQMEKK